MEIVKEFIEYFAIAFVASACLIFMAKIVMNKLIRKDVNYYEDVELEEEERMLRGANIVRDRDCDRKEGY